MKSLSASLELNKLTTTDKSVKENQVFLRKLIEEHGAKEGNSRQAQGGTGEVGGEDEEELTRASEELVTRMGKLKADEAAEED